VNNFAAFKANKYFICILFYFLMNSMIELLMRHYIIRVPGRNSLLSFILAVVILLAIPISQAKCNPFQTDSVLSGNSAIHTPEQKDTTLNDTILTDSTAYSECQSDTAQNQALIGNQPKDTISLVLVGDVMLGTNYPSSAYLPPSNNCSQLLDSVRSLLLNADLTFGNLEGVFAGDEGTPKSCKDPTTCYVFRMPDEYVHCLIDAGFDLVSVANNHVNDFGYMGRMHSARVLKDAGLHFAGFIDYPYTIISIDSLKIGFCAFAPHSGVVDLRDLSKAEEIVKYLADTCDIVLVSMHAGGEGQDFQHITRENEVFLGNDRGNVYQFAHHMIDAGADVIIGHGPHVTKAMEVYNDRFIAYSLGNFCTYSRFNLNGPNGIAPLVQLYIDRQGRVLSAKIIPVKQTGEGGPRIDTEKRVIYKLQLLQQADFKDKELRITDEGLIRF
jgi:poly-gamma-glutamate capsule biosynthesis protein CapA/YwtB (metallophosphatase superfamily)